MDNKKANKEFNLPSYINIPLFLYQDNRLDKPATLLAGFFYSLHTANKDISASTDYVCALLKVTDRHVYRILNQLENLRYISRSGSTNNRMINWIYNVSANITITESNETTDAQDTSLQTTDADVSSSSTTDTQVSKLLTHRSVNYCPAGHTYNKEYIKGISAAEKNTAAAVDPLGAPPPQDLFYLFKTLKIKTPKTLTAKGSILLNNAIEHLATLDEVLEDYLIYLDSECSRWLHAPYIDSRGRERENDFYVILRIDIIDKAFNGQFKDK